MSTMEKANQMVNLLIKLFYYKKRIFLSKINYYLLYIILDGYLAQLQKSHIKKPQIKTYSIKDYRNFKKDAPPVTNVTTGKLGFDYDNENYKKRVSLSCIQVIFYVNKLKLFLRLRNRKNKLITLKE